ncbi:MAG: transglycosylase SLT domain-containing protein [Ignavibacteria bacterium]
MRKNVPELSKLLKNILFFVIPFAFLVILLRILTKGESDSKSNFPSSESILSPYEVVVKYKVYDYKDYFDKMGNEQISNLENLVYNWQSLLDIFTSNDINKQLKYTISKPTLVKLSNKIKKSQEEFFKGSSDDIIKEYGSVIKEEAEYYKLDWRLILSMIKQESAFTSNAVSSAGAYGFMQIMPRTGLTLEQTLNLEDHRSPKNNLIAGIYYYALLTARYDATGEDKYKFALAAYNAGSGHVEDAMSIAYYLGKDYLKWNNVKETIKMLGPENDSLHQKIWNSKPPNGIFTNWKEPVNYVSRIIYYWSEYDRIYPDAIEKPKKKKAKN